MVVPFLGEIVIYPYDEAKVPAGWLPCDGRELQIDHCMAFYTVIGTKFGGNGQTTFALPDFRSIAPPQAQYYIASEGIFPSPN